MTDSIILLFNRLGVATRLESLFMNRRGDCVGSLVAADFEKRGRSYAYGQLTRNALWTHEQARAR
ncbi:MAG: hypothetical protein Q9M08_03060 [Mariprofundus sp.]|nr:hypothetical protein [Mariprofundus sp.]